MRSCTAKQRVALGRPSNSLAVLEDVSLPTAILADCDVISTRRFASIRIGAVICSRRPRLSAESECFSSKSTGNLFSIFVLPSFAALSAFSLPSTPLCPGIQCRLT